ncbi:InlB B-repeat-containing protein, partial [Clostridium sp. DL1XJH146]
MKKIKAQKWLFSTIIICMMVTMFSGINTTTVKALRGSVNVSTVTELKNAIASATDGDTINITSDIIIDAEIEIDKDLIIQGENHTIKVPVTGLDDSGIANTDPSDYRVFKIISTSERTVEINDLTIKGGKYSNGDGAGIYNPLSSTLKLTNVNISNTINNSSGGGIKNDGVVYLVNSTISGNVSKNGAGGGIFNTGVAYLVNSNISGNAAYTGGGFMNYIDAKMFIENSTFSENRATLYSGGTVENQGQLYINNSTFSNNTAVRYGGAIYNCNESAKAYIVNSTFTGNVVYGTYSGGAITNDNGTLSVLNTLFAYNYIKGTTSFILNDLKEYTADKNIDAYNCIYHAAIDWDIVNDKGGNSQYTGSADGSDNSIFKDGNNINVLDINDSVVEGGTVFQPILEKADGIDTPTTSFKEGSDILVKGIKTSFTNGNGTPTIGYFDGSTWITLIGSDAENYEVKKDQNDVDRRAIPTVGSVETTYVNSYAVTFDVDGGSTVASESVVYNTKVTNPAAPTKTGYSFGGWYTDNTFATLFDFDSVLVTEDTTIYAKWNINSYAVTFDVDGG